MPPPAPTDTVSLEIQVSFEAPDASPEAQELIRQLIAIEVRRFSAAVADEIEHRGIDVTVTGVDGD